MDIMLNDQIFALVSRMQVTMAGLSLCEKSTDFLTVFALTKLKPSHHHS